MDKRVIHQKLLIKASQKEEEKELLYINKPDPEPVQFWLFRWVKVFSRG